MNIHSMRRMALWICCSSALACGDEQGTERERFGFSVPPGPIPQTVTCNRNGPAKPVYEACVP